MKSGNEQQKKREARKKRRVRNQVIAYTVMGILILALAAGIVFGVNSLLKGRRTAGQQEAQQSRQEEDQPDTPSDARGNGAHASGAS